MAKLHFHESPKTVIKPFYHRHKRLKYLFTMSVALNIALAILLYINKL